MEEEYIITSATFRLNNGDSDEISSLMKEYADKRNTKQPLKYPSCGSVFKRPCGTFAGKLIEDAGLKGYRMGGVMVSDLHAGFIINIENGTATELENLINYIQEVVFKKYGIMLTQEIRII